MTASILELLTDLNNQDKIKSLPKVSPVVFGLDPRIGRYLYVMTDGLLLKKEDDYAFQYYSFLNFDESTRYELGDFVAYSVENSTVNSWIENFYETF